MSRKKKVSRSKMREKKNRIKNRKRSIMNASIKSQIVRMRREADKGAGIDVPQNVLLDLDEEFCDPKCDGVGDCCMNYPIMVDHADLQRIVSNEKVKNTFNVVTTMDLCNDVENRSLLNYWIDKKSGVPMCFVRRDTGEDSNQRCAFFVEENKSCLLGDDKPTVCLSNPLRRIAKSDKGKMAGWRYRETSEACSECLKRCDGEMEKVSVEKHIESNVTKDRYESSELFHGLCGWLSKNVKSEELRKLAAMMLFDFDRFSIEIGGLSLEDAINSRPGKEEIDMVTVLVTKVLADIEGRNENDKGKPEKK